MHVTTTVAEATGGWARTRRWGAQVVAGERLLLAAKAAAAGVVAWGLARLLPGFLDDYAYYAPFGAVIAMMPSVVESLRTALHTVAGLALGGLLAWAAFTVGASIWVTVPVVIVLAVLVAGALPVGPGRDYVPVAAIFVLMSGGGDPESFGIAYVLLTGMGLVVGTVVNLGFWPPVRVLAVQQGLDALRRDASHLLEELALELEDPERDAVPVVERARSLERRIGEVEDAVADAHRTRWGNPRAARGRYATVENEEQLGVLEASVHELVALASVVAAERVTPEVPADLPEAVRHAVAEALRALAASQLEDDSVLDEVRDRSVEAREALRSWTPTTQASAAAVGAMEHHLLALETRITGGSRTSAA